jgi:hypothetical protein
LFEPARSTISGRRSFENEVTYADRLPRGISVIVIAALAVLAWAALIAIVILVLNPI